MKIKRAALDFLERWRVSPSRKALVVRGPRQVGKTTLVRAFAKSFGRRFIELNLEKSADRRLFDIDDAHDLLKAILLSRQIPMEGGPLLLFIDEIQESPAAIRQLRYFTEEIRDIHVVAAGSMLDHVLGEVGSFPVGRVEYLYLHPVNFQEYLGAVNEVASYEIMQQIPLPAYAHAPLLGSFNRYAILGGMPEVVANFSDHQNFVSVSKIYNRLWTAYKDDVEKYAKGSTERKVIRHIMETAASEKDRIKMEGFGSSNYRSREVSEAMQSLDRARILRLLYPTTSLEPPLNIDRKKRPRLQFLDTGLLNHMLSLQSEMIGLEDLTDFYRGRIIEHIVNQEITSIHDDSDFRPHFWVREDKNASAEVDLVYQVGTRLVPIEIKSGKQGTLRSLHQFIERTNHAFGVRIYGGTFRVEHHQTPGGKPYTLMNLPYYLTAKLPAYLSWLFSTEKP